MSQLHRSCKSQACVTNVLENPKPVPANTSRAEGQESTVRHCMNVPLVEEDSPELLHQRRAQRSELLSAEEV